MNLLIIIVWSIEYQKTVKNANHNFLKPKMTSWNALFLSEKQSKTQIHPVLTDKLELEDVWLEKDDLNDSSFIKIVADSLSVNQQSHKVPCFLWLHLYN